MIHEQVQKQLNYLKYRVENEKKREITCNKWGLPYEPSRRKLTNEKEYNDYLKEVNTNGDKNLIVMIELHGEDNINMYGVYPFVKRSINNENNLIYRTKYGTEILIQKNKNKVIDREEWMLRFIILILCAIISTEIIVKYDMMEDKE